MLNVSEVVALLARGKGAKFGNIVYRVKRDNSLARYHVILGARTEPLYKKDIAILETDIKAGKYSDDATMYEAACTILNSRKKSLEVGIGNNPDYTNANTYTHVEGVPGVKIHKETGVLYVSALVEDKTILEEGEPQKPVNSKPLTIAKRKIEATLPSGRFRQFIIKRVNRAAAHGEVIEIEGDSGE